MKKRNHFSIPTKYIFAVLAAVCVILMFLSYSTGLGGTELGRIAGYIFVPFEQGLNGVGGWMREKKDTLEDLAAVQAHNQELQALVDELTMENSLLTQNQYRLAQLEELYELDQTYGNFNKVASNIIATDGGNWFNTFVIDKGKEDGVDEGMNVIAGSGLVGIVIDTGPNYAKVRSIIDDASNVSGMALSTADRCIVTGNLVSMNDEQVIGFTDLKCEDDAVKAGEQLVTSHISDKYLEGILIGYVSTIERNANNLTYSGTVTPAVDFQHLQEVLVILDKKETPAD